MAGASVDPHRRPPTGVEGALFVRLEDKRSAYMGAGSMGLLLLCYSLGLAQGSETMRKANFIGLLMTGVLFPIALYYALRKSQPRLVADEQGLRWYETSSQWCYCEWAEISGLELRPFRKSFQVGAQCKDGKRRWAPFAMTPQDLRRLLPLAAERVPSSGWSELARTVLQKVSAKEQG